jgi:quinol monooxygenase YgiN
VELRQYTLHPGRRDELVELFDREFVHTQEQTGIAVLGQFRDLDDPDRFVWLRGFPGMAQRAAALAAFYGGPAWRAHRDRANATMLDSDDVLLLCPAGGPMTAASTVDNEPGTLLVTVYPLTAAARPAFPAFFHDRVRPVLARSGAAPLAAWQTLHAENTFPALPIREDAEVFVWLARFDGPAALEEHLKRRADDPAWRDTVAPALGAFLTGPPVGLRLAPTPGSRLR